MERSAEQGIYNQLQINKGRSLGRFRFLGRHMYLLLCSFCDLAPNIPGGHSGPFSLHLSHQDSV